MRPCSALPLFWALIAVGVACSSAGTGSTALWTEDWGELSSPSPPLLDNPAAMRMALDFARETLRGESTAMPPEILLAAPGRRVFLTAYVRGSDRTTPPLAPAGTGYGGTLAASVRAAAVALAKSLGPVAKYRLKIDVAVAAEARRARGAIWLAEDELGKRGIHVAAGGTAGWLAPSEIIERALVDTDARTHLSDTAVARDLEARGATRAVGGDKAVSYAVFDSRAWIEGPDGEGAHALDAVFARARPAVTSDRLAAGARAGAEYLSRMVGERGRYVYVLDPRTARPGTSYNMTRHGGTTFALLQAYRRFGDERFLAAGRRSLEYLRERTEERVAEGMAFAFIAEGPKAKLGAAALALLAFEEYVAATGDRSFLEEMRRYARFMVRLQEADGHFISIWQHDPERPVAPFESEYYPGEAIFALARLYALDPDPVWLETAEKGAKWLTEVRDKGKGPDRLLHDHWLLYAMSHLYRHTRRPAYVVRTRLICAAIETSYVVGRDGPLRSAPNATRVEGIDAAIDTARLAGIDESRWTELARELLAYQLPLQFDEMNSYYLPDPALVRGGFPASVLDLSIRIDYVQHSVSAMLALERHLARARGIEHPGAP